MFKALIASTIGTFFLFICQLLIVPFLLIFGISSTTTIRPVVPPATPTFVPTLTEVSNTFELTATQLILDATATGIPLTPTESADSGSNNPFSDRATQQAETAPTLPPTPTATPESSDSSDSEDDGSTNLFDQRATQQSDD